MAGRASGGSPSPEQGGESEADTSSSTNKLNAASMMAQKGTEKDPSFDDDKDEDTFDESSIEALNWSEGDEEELVELTLGPKPMVVVHKKKTSLEPKMETSDSTTVHLLSSSLLQSMDSNASTSSESESKNRGIQSWASEVKHAAEIGEMEAIEGESDEITTNKTGLRKRKNIDELTTSVASGLTSESCPDDALSSAPVLDDGPIWNKGPKRYRFEENRRVNQKLSICVLLAVVLAVGLGLGNLVAYNECETEYKQASLQTPPAEEKKETPPEPLPTPPPAPKKRDIELDREEYSAQMETLSKIVNTLDNLQRKIDKFENTTRRMGGVVMLEDPSEVEESSSNTRTVPGGHYNNDEVSDLHPYSELEEEVHTDSDYTPEDAALDEEDFILDLIEGIEETVTYLTRQDALKSFEAWNDKRVEPPNLFADDESTNDWKDDHVYQDNLRTVEATVKTFKKAHDEFIRKERDELRANKILGLAEERTPEEYSSEERAEVKRKYDKFMIEYPFKSEVDVEKERLKFVRENENENGPGSETSLEEDIDSFFKDFSTPPLDGPEDIFKSDEENEKEDPFSEKDKQKEKEENFGSGSGNGGKRPKFKKHKHKKNNEKWDKSSGNNDYHRKQQQHKDKNKKKSSYRPQDENGPPKGNHFRGYDLSTWDHDEDGDDDDDHKRRKYAKSSSSDPDSYNNNAGHHRYHHHSKKEDSNWLLERNKAREDIRNNLGVKVIKSQQHQKKKNASPRFEKEQSSRGGKEGKERRRK